MSLKLRKYLKILKSESSRLERTDINNITDDSFKAKYLKSIFFSIVSALATISLREGFSDGFVSYVSSVLSILVGLFITALVFSFDKFYKPLDVENPNARMKLWDKQAYTYTKKFAFITSRTIVLSIYTLVLISLSAFHECLMNLNLFNLSFNPKAITNLDWKSIGTFFLSLIVIFQRFFVFYWLQKIIYNTLFIVSSLVQYMTTKIDQ